MYCLVLYDSNNEKAYLSGVIHRLVFVIKTLCFIRGKKLIFLIMYIECRPRLDSVQVREIHAIIFSTNNYHYSFECRSTNLP
jgi:hypothetical protein